MDGLLTISDYYQVGFLKKRCEDLLLACPVTATRLVQAHRHGLHKQYERCLSSIVASCSAEDLALIHQASPHIMLEVAQALRKIADTATLPARAKEQARKFLSLKNMRADIQDIRNILDGADIPANYQPVSQGSAFPSVMAESDGDSAVLLKAKLLGKLEQMLGLLA